MIRFIDSDKMGRSRLGWLDSRFHFSFAEYYNPQNINFGVLRVVNDDLVQPGTGFDTHPHRDMEILSYVVNGQLTHADSMKNRQTLTRGQVQYMSAGTGITHSEFNLGDSVLRFLQIWIFPDKNGHTPQYGDCRFTWEDRVGTWLPIASGGNNSKFPIHIHADVHVYATEVPQGQTQRFAVGPGRQAYLVLIEGQGEANGHTLKMRDALEATEEDVAITAKTDCHMLAIEMKKEA